MRELAAYGIRWALPPGWEGAIFRRPPVNGESTYPVTHLATFPLPAGRGDFGDGAVERMGWGDVFVALVEYGPESANTALFADGGVPVPLPAREFRAHGLARMIPGQGGGQWFFQEAGRPFSLYVVLGRLGQQARLVPIVDGVLATLEVAPTALGGAS